MLEMLKVYVWVYVGVCVGVYVGGRSETETQKVTEIWRLTVIPLKKTPNFDTSDLKK